MNIKNPLLGIMQRNLLVYAPRDNMSLVVDIPERSNLGTLTFSHQ